jgi:hypothetical protein
MPWAGLIGGIVLSVVFGLLWSRRGGQPLLLIGILAGVAFSVVGVSLMLPSLKLLFGALPSYELGTGYDLGNDTPMEVELVTIEGGAPRTDLLYMGDVYESRNDSGTSYLYSVVAPVVPAEWEPSAPVPAWVICEVSRRSTGKQQSAKDECIERLADEAASYERETFDADLPNAPMVEKAMAQHDLTQTDDAPIFVLFLADDIVPGIVAPLVLLLVALGGVRSGVKRSLEESTPAEP